MNIYKLYFVFQKQWKDIEHKYAKKKEEAEEWSDFTTTTSKQLANINALLIM